MLEGQGKINMCLKRRQETLTERDVCNYEVNARKCEKMKNSSTRTVAEQTTNCATRLESGMKILTVNLNIHVAGKSVDCSLDQKQRRVDVYCELQTMANDDYL